jgi:hypothetical protein
VEPNQSSSSWAIPDGVTVAPGVELEAEDPSWDGRRRQCVALTRAGARCSVNALGDLLLCTAHAGRLDASAGGRARARHLALVQEEAETRMVQARMGARAVIAQRAIERASDLRCAFDTVLDATLAGDKTAARTLLGYLTAAFPEATQQPGKPSSSEADALTTLSTDELRALAFETPRAQH